MNMVRFQAQLKAAKQFDLRIKSLLRWNFSLIRSRRFTHFWRVHLQEFH